MRRINKFGCERLCNTDTALFWNKLGTEVGVQEDGTGL